MSKKLLVVAVAAIGGALALRKVAADRNAEQDLWAEATDRVVGRARITLDARSTRRSRHPSWPAAGTWLNW